MGHESRLWTIDESIEDEEEQQRVEDWERCYSPLQKRRIHKFLWPATIKLFADQYVARQLSYKFPEMMTRRTPGAIKKECNSSNLLQYFIPRPNIFIFPVSFSSSLVKRLPGIHPVILEPTRTGQRTHLMYKRILVDNHYPRLNYLATHSAQFHFWTPESGTEITPSTISSSHERS